MKCKLCDSDIEQGRLHSIEVAVDLCHECWQSTGEPLWIGKLGIDKAGNVQAYYPDKPVGIATDATHAFEWFEVVILRREP